MSKGRLTRQELGWLLTQEASGAAERLRLGVQVLKTNAPPAPSSLATPEIVDPVAQTGLDATLDALDDAMKMLSSLHQRPSAVRGRRGRIDLASLIWEVAPDARVSIEPGSGTEVLGDEGELRRMLHVLIGHGTGAGSAITIRRDSDDVRVAVVLGPDSSATAETEPGSAITIRRDSDDVRVAVVLGPDSSATAETERAWMSRMAIRYGGRYELEGGAEVLTLPADGVSERNEREALRRELEEARKQGEVYARELAQAYAQEGPSSTSPSTFPPAHPMPAHERFGVLSRFASGIAAELRAMLSPAARLVPPPRPASGPGGPPSASAEPAAQAEERWDTVRRALARTQDFVGALAHLGELDPEESAADVDLVEAAKNAASSLTARAERSDVKVTVTGEPQGVRTAPRAVAVLLREILGQAIAASPRGSEVKVAIEGSPGGVSITCDDAGAPLPAKARRAFLGLELEPGTYGRSTSVPLYVAGEIASWRGATLELADAPSGGVRVTVTFPRARG
jgi:signal transduction histidine kinase